MKPGEVVAGRYRLAAPLGVGAMGEVWRAVHGDTGRELAVKIMHTHAGTSPAARERFSREARISARINHPNAIAVFDAGETADGSLYLAMELLDGISLADALYLEPPLSAQDLLTVMHGAAQALAAAHAVGIVHRDVKPGNVFLHRVQGSGLAVAKILDFGISKILEGEMSQTSTGAVLGSPRYMSPEQARSAATVDHRTDLWACGVILFEGLTGTWPHEGDSFSNLVVALCTQPPASIDQLAPRLPEAVRAVVRDCLKPREQRIQTASELAARLAAALQDGTLAQWPLARPRYSEGESIRLPGGIRMRPLVATGEEPRSAPPGGMASEDDRPTPLPRSITSPGARSPEPAPVPEAPPVEQAAVAAPPGPDDSSDEATHVNQGWSGAGTFRLDWSNLPAPSPVFAAAAFARAAAASAGPASDPRPAMPDRPPLGVTMVVPESAPPSRPPVQQPPSPTVVMGGPGAPAQPFGARPPAQPFGPGQPVPGRPPYASTPSAAPDDAYPDLPTHVYQPDLPTHVFQPPAGARPAAPRRSSSGAGLAIAAVSIALVVAVALVAVLRPSALRRGGAAASASALPASSAAPAPASPK